MFMHIIHVLYNIWLLFVITSHMNVLKVVSETNGDRLKTHLSLKIIKVLILKLHFRISVTKRRHIGMQLLRSDLNKTNNQIFYLGIVSFYCSLVNMMESTFFAKFSLDIACIKSFIYMLSLSN